jgi:hypothetical protein
MIPHPTDGHSVPVLFAYFMAKVLKLISGPLELVIPVSESIFDVKKIVKLFIRCCDHANRRTKE